MTHQEKKQEIWNELVKKYSHLTDFCEINPEGIDDDSMYYHPKFKLSEYAYVRCQGDDKNNYLYAFRFVFESKHINVEFDESLLDSIIIGYHTNIDVVVTAVDTLAKVRNKITIINKYCNEYVANILIGNSINESTECLINELKANQKLITYLQKQ